MFCLESVVNLFYLSSCCPVLCFSQLYALFSLMLQIPTSPFAYIPVLLPIAFLVFYSSLDSQRSLSHPYIYQLWRRISYACCDLQSSIPHLAPLTSLEFNLLKKTVCPPTTIPSPSSFRGGIRQGSHG